MEWFCHSTAFNLLRKCQVVFQSVCPVLHPQRWLSPYEGSSCSSFSLTLCTISLTYITIVVYVKDSTCFNTHESMVLKLCCSEKDCPPHHTISQVSPRLWGFWGLLPGQSTYPQGLLNSNKTVLPTCWWIEKRVTGSGK